MGGRTYSSYLLDQFQTCPRLFDLSHRWSVLEGSWSVSLHLGSAVSVGLAALRQGKTKKAAEELAYAELAGRYVENDEWTLVGVLKHVYRGMELGFSSDLGLKSIISADQQTYDHSRPDVVGRTPGGKLRIVDDKVKLKLDVKYLDDTLNEYKHSNQLYMYAWKVGKHYNEPVESVCINLIILSPSPRVVFYPMTLTQEAIEYWAEGAQWDFGDMEKIEEHGTYARVRWTSCTSKYNMPGTFTKALCSMYKICHDGHGDEAVAETLGYERR
jgi:hypothetical protein